MNCVNCGANLAYVDGRDYFRCDFCGSLEFRLPLQDSPDALVALNQSGEENCPLCHSELAAGSLDGARVCYCQACRGILLESDVFSQLVRQRRANHQGPSETPAPLNADELSRKLNCPHCQRRMEVHPYYGPGNAVIDSCAACGLVWLDFGELAAIERAPGLR